MPWLYSYFITYGPAFNVYPPIVEHQVSQPLSHCIIILEKSCHSFLYFCSLLISQSQSSCAARLGTQLEQKQRQNTKYNIVKLDLFYSYFKGISVPVQWHYHFGRTFFLYFCSFLVSESQSIIAVLLVWVRSCKKYQSFFLIPPL